MKRQRKQVLEDPTAIESLAVARLVQLNAAVQGIVVGLLFGVSLFVATNWLVLKGGRVVGPHLALLGHFLIGYRVTFAGSLVGLAYGFLVGFLVGYTVTVLYNRLVGFHHSR